MTRKVGYYGLGEMVITGTGLHNPIMDVFTGEMLPIKDIPPCATYLGIERHGTSLESYCIAHSGVWDDRWNRRLRQIQGDYSDLMCALESVRGKDPAAVDAFIAEWGLSRVCSDGWQGPEDEFDEVKRSRSGMSM